MKKYFQLVFVSFIIVNMVFALSACGDKKNEENNIGQNNNEKNEIRNNVEETEDMNMKVRLTEDSIVIAEEDTATEMILTFDAEDKVERFYMTVEAETDEDAQLLKSIYSSEEMLKNCTVRLEGKKVIIEYNDEYINAMFGEETRATIEAGLKEFEE